MRLPLLDGLRGLAALLVVLMHAEDITFGTKLFAHGYLAVDLFFLLSGFVLTLAFERRFAAGFGPLSFMRLRIARLWPMVAIGVALCSIVYLQIAPPLTVLTTLGRNLLLLPASCTGGAVYCLNPPAWSLACEFAANLAHACILWRLSDRTLGLLAAMAGMLLAAAIFSHGSADLGVLSGTMGGGYLRCAFGYTLGVWMARKWQAARPIGLPWWQGLAPAIAVPFIIQLIDAPLAVLDAAACLVILPACFWLAIQATNPPSLDAVFDWLGRRSFPLYAVSQPVNQATAMLAIGLGIANAVSIFVFMIAASLVISELALLAGLGGRPTWRRRAAPLAAMA